MKTVSILDKINSGFPNYRRRGLWPLVWKVENGWMDLGRVKPQWDYAPDDSNCKVCNRKVMRVGRDLEGIFWYCPKCLLKHEIPGLRKASYAK